MANVYYFNSDELLRLFNPRSCANYYNDPDQLELEIKHFLLTSNNQKWSDEYSLTGYDWQSDFKKLVYDFIQDKGLEYELYESLERHCSRSSYLAIDEQRLSYRYPPPSKLIIPNQTEIDIVDWSIEQKESTIEITLVRSGSWKDALTTLLFTFLFYNFHALQAKALNYKYVGGTCRSCEKVYITTTTGRKTKYCSKKCKDRENVKVFRMKRKEEQEVLQAQ